ncbi:Methyltransferase type 11 [Acidilobus saccharovorans 345-15]|uniref:Methyltransferase type 11 n=1 Tax=Acidilobus saccharovorans (strain DSM 16705 / JCM 18335 / VKM B-2471 / 345-15) TaxID=666510 RepID=D9PZ47_ACIS3|nr:methyltransferase domain-containing protein [Acidilobus saccharovorans]ADL19834.1 Methyltransferase type 11 [Acidilobus saccharovorans 345-15]
MSGLEGELWNLIVDDIQRLSTKGCYEPVSDAISFYLARKLRVLAAALIGLNRDPPEAILDAGCGPGTSTKVVRALYPRAKVVAMDPGALNLLRASRAAGDGTGAAQGMFEHMPFREGSFDGAVAMFSFRDAANYLMALDEFSRVLKDDGRLAILDLYRPENSLELAMSLMQFRYIGPAIGLAMGCGRDGLKFGDIYRTVLSMLTPSQLVREASRRFRRVSFKPTPFLVGILYAEGPRRPS